ncbi:MAG: cell division protein FtsB [Legionellales bacterium]|nr:cell division protein FtsB [Legionellales bacterium]|tara:strand:+ start:18000 stop:18269 length:270 start_codon:yes stop_codon:yes gene_type:complete
MKALTTLTVVLFLVLQCKLWFGDGGLSDVLHLKKSIAQQQLVNNELTAKNTAMLADINDLKRGHQAIEARARNELGMVKQGEVFYDIIT